MTNFEKYKDEILHHIDEYDELPGIKDGVIIQCGSASCCCNCKFSGDDDCNALFVAWLYQEYKEPTPKLTPKERAFCEITKVGYIARNKFGSLYSFFVKPTREGEDWCSDSNYRLISAEYFQFIKWEAEPWSIKDLLKLEVE